MATDKKKAARQKRRKAKIKQAKIKQAKYKTEPRQRRKRLLLRGQRGGGRK